MDVIQSYVTCSSERQRKIKEEWDAADRSSHMPPTQTEELYLSENDHDQGGHYKSKKHRPNYEDDLSLPWLCEETDPFTAKIRNLEVLKKTHMPTNVKMYDGTGDLEDHLKIFQEETKIERWAMPTWYHMFNSMLIGSTRMYIKDPVEIHHIKQREGESTEAFMERFKAESMHVSGALECIRISGFMHGGKTVSPLTKTPKEILAMETVKFKAPPPMIGPVENQNKNKFCEFHRDKGHNTDECIHLRRQGEQAKAAKKGEAPNKEKATAIFMVQPWQWITRQKVTQSFFVGREISFPPLKGVPRSIAKHHLSIREGCQPIRQKRKGHAPDRNKAIQEEVAKLVKAEIMREVHYHDWISNPVMVKRHDGSWRMCVDFTDLNKSYTKDCYPLLEIDWKIESLYEYPFKYFLDAYKGYHQIQMAEEDEEKPAFHTIQGVYVDDLVIKSHTEHEILRDIEETFHNLRKINMKLNPKKCTFGAEEGAFLGYVVSMQGIKACPEKAEAVMKLQSPQTLKEAQSLNGKLASLNRFLTKSAEKSLPFFKTLKRCVKKSDFHWTPKAERAF
ncbi:hypothetical protein Tco_1061013, partial [Tanacetum coccineum]